MLRVLYHGTDARISLMSDEERKAFRQDIFAALDYMWNLMEPYFQKFDEVVDRAHNRVRRIERIKRFEGTVSDEMYNKLYRSLSHDKARRDGLYTWQYQDNMIYLTADIETAISYAYRSFVFGELGETVWEMYQGMKALNLDTWNPDMKIQSTLDRIQRMAEEDPVPVVYLVTYPEREKLFTDAGKPVTDEELEYGSLFRYEDEYMYLDPRNLDNVIYLLPKADISQFFISHSKKPPFGYRWWL